MESGEAERLGIEERCKGDDPLFLPACHAVRGGVGPMSTRLTYTSGDLGGDTDTAFEAALETARADEAAPRPHLIGGEAVAEGEVFERRDPSHTDAVASRAHAASAELVERAVAAAGAAAPGWAATPYGERCALMRAAAEAIGERHIELAAVASLETGKSRTESILEVQEAVDLITTYADLMEENEGYTRPMDSFVESERNVDVLRPYGAFAVIAPFNFPVALAVNMSSAALIAGNPVVLKPSEEAPWTGALLGEVMAGLPPGVFNLVHGGPETGQALVESAVAGVAFTGSAEVGREIARRMQDGPFARPALTEMGGKNPAIVTASADLAAAAEGVARSAFGLSGQKCSACSRAIVAGRGPRRVRRAARGRGGQARSRRPGRPRRVPGPGDQRGEREALRGRGRGRPPRGAGGRRRWAARTSRGTSWSPPWWRDFRGDTRSSGTSCFSPWSRSPGWIRSRRRWRRPTRPCTGSPPGSSPETRPSRSAFSTSIQAGVVYVNRRAGATTGAWPGTQTFCGWKSSGSTGKGGLGPWYLPQFMREQSRTIVRG